MPKVDQGVYFDRYSVIPRVLVFIFNKDKVLLIKGSPTKRIWSNQYNGIGGHIERGEDVRSAARREVKEESGLDISKMVLCGTVMIDAAHDRGISLYVYKAWSTSGKMKESVEGTLEWVAMNSLDSIRLVEDLKVILPVIYKMKTGDEPFSARYAYDNRDQLVICFGK